MNSTIALPDCRQRPGHNCVARLAWPSEGMLRIPPPDSSNSRATGQCRTDPQPKAASHSRDKPRTPSHSRGPLDSHSAADETGCVDCRTNWPGPGLKLCARTRIGPNSLRGRRQTTAELVSARATAGMDTAWSRTTDRIQTIIGFTNVSSAVDSGIFPEVVRSAAFTVCGGAILLPNGGPLGKPGILAVVWFSFNL